MSRTCISILMAPLLIIGVAAAEEVSLELAGKVINAQVNSINASGIGPVAPTGEVQTCYDLYGQKCAYIQPLYPMGFVAISVDDRMEPLLGYSYTHDFVWDEDPDNMMLQLLRADIQTRRRLLAQQTPVEISRTQEKWRHLEHDLTTHKRMTQTVWPEPGTTVTGGWLETVWGQGYPYNARCPFDDSVGRRSPVGCVATAMSQIVNFHGYPSDIGDFSDADDYICMDSTFVIDDDCGTNGTLTWSELNSTLNDVSYPIPSNSTAGLVDELCYVCGVSIQMDYGVWSSGADPEDVPAALLTRFGYTSAEWKEREEDDFFDVLKANMKDALPAEMSIRDTFRIDGDLWYYGHAIVVDGFDEVGPGSSDDLYHLNYGWGKQAYCWWWNLLAPTLPSDDDEIQYDCIAGAVMNIRAGGECFVIANPGATDLAISHVTVDKPWLKMSLDTAVVPPGQQCDLCAIITDWSRVALPYEEAIITIFSNAMGQPVSTVTLRAYPKSARPALCVDSVDWTDPPVPCEGGTHVVMVSNCGSGGTFTWTAKSDRDWIHANPATGSPGQTFEISVDSNHGMTPRNGSVSVMADGVNGSPQTIEVLQEACDTVHSCELTVTGTGEPPQTRAFGVATDGSDGYDEELDETCPPPDGSYHVYFEMSESPVYLCRDIRGWPPSDECTEWTLKVVRASGKQTVIAWDKECILFEDGNFTIDGANMGSQETYSFNGDRDVVIKCCSGTCGDVNDDISCNSTDALVVLSYDVGRPVPAAMEDKIDQGCADVNHDGASNSTDALIILSHDVGFPVPFCVCECGCPCPGTPGAKLVVVKGTKATVGASEHMSVRGEIVIVPVVVDLSRTSERLGSYSGSLSWDPRVLAYVGYTGGTAVGFDEPLVNENETEAGRLSFADARVEGAQGEVNIISMSFQVTGSDRSFSPLDVSFEAMLAARSFNDLLGGLEVKNSRIAVLALPATYALRQNYPNPFNPETEIEFELPENAKVTIAIHNILGQVVEVLLDKELEAGYHYVRWNGGNMASGVYFCRMTAAGTSRGSRGDFVETKRMLMLK